VPVAVSDDPASPGDGGTTCGTPVKYGDPERYRSEHHLARYDEDTIERLNLAA